MKNRRNLKLGAAVALAFAGLLTYLLIGQFSSQCGQYSNDKLIRIGEDSIIVEVAHTAKDRAKGLGGRPCIESNHGMLFIFEQPGQYSFWMKDMKFPIDIVWVDASHKVVDLDKNVQPSTYPSSFVPAEPARYVLELQANRAQSLNISEGTVISF